jgi:hypothetical protein
MNILALKKREKRIDENVSSKKELRVLYSVCSPSAFSVSSRLRATYSIVRSTNNDTKDIMVQKKISTDDAEMKNKLLSSLFFRVLL